MDEPCFVCKPRQAEKIYLGAVKIELSPNQHWIGRRCGDDVVLVRMDVEMSIPYADFDKYFIYN